MNGLQRIGGFAALYLALAYVIGIVLFLVVLDYPSITDPAQKVALVVDKQPVIYASNLILYVVFGSFLVVLALALHHRLAAGAAGIMQPATAIGIIWAGSLVASGMVSNGGIAPVVALFGKNPTQAAMTWLAIETVATGLGNGNGEILGGLWTLLVSWAALRTHGLPKFIGYLGILVGLVGIISVIPAITSLVGVFGVTQGVWLVALAPILLRLNDSRT